MATTNDDVIRAVLQSWGHGVDAAKAATRAYFADACEYFDRTNFTR